MEQEMDILRMIKEHRNMKIIIENSLLNSEIKKQMMHVEDNIIDID